MSSCPMCMTQTVLEWQSSGKESKKQASQIKFNPKGVTQKEQIVLCGVLIDKSLIKGIFSKFLKTASLIVFKPHLLKTNVAINTQP
jgi:hypothetical protein